MNKLDEIFGVESQTKEIVPVSNKDIIVVDENSSSTNHEETDYEFARNNLYGLIQQGSQAMEGILQVARESNSPRAFEVVATLIKTISDTNDKLMDLQKTKQELLKKDKKDSSGVNVNNAVFVGSTADLLKLTKKE